METQRQKLVVTSTNAAPVENRALPWWVAAAVVFGALLMAAGAAIALLNPAMLVSPGAEINSAAHVYAGYLVSRNLALAAMLVAALVLRARGALTHLMVLTALIQLIDGGMDLIEGRWAIVPVVLIYAVVFFLGAARISGHAFWKPAAWHTAA